MRLAAETLRLGCVKYLNARPLISGYPGRVDYDHPTVLCQKLAAGELDVALVSSVEYLRRPHYRIVDGVSISAMGPVYSVIVTPGLQLGRIQEIKIDPASQTSVALLRCLLHGRGLSPRLTQMGSAAPTRDTGNNRGDQPTTARLLIGDQAIQYRHDHPEAEVLDLAQEWTQMTGLPFVFALWLIRSEVSDPRSIAEALRHIRDTNITHLDSLVVEPSRFDREFCRRYFSHYLRFDFGVREKAGLREFHHRCLRAGLEVSAQLSLELV